MKKLTLQDIYKKCDLSHLNFITTKDIQPLEDELLNQEKAKEILDFGLSLNRYGYNIFLSGESSSRRKIYLKKILNIKAEDKTIPNDICYVHNFKEERKPVLITLNPGLGINFKQDMQDFIDKIKDEFESIFNDRGYKKERESIEQKFDEIAEDSFNKFAEISKNDYKHTIEFGQDGQVYISPIHFDGKALSADEFENLSAKASSFYKSFKNKVGMLVVEMLDEQDKIQSKREKELEDIDKKNIEIKIDELLNPLIDKYSAYSPKMEVFFNGIKEDLLKNIDAFKNDSTGTAEISLFGATPSSESSLNDITKKYSVNLVVDNKDLKQAPVIFANNSFDGTSLFGTAAIFVDSKGMMTTDFTQIRAGEVLKANGGFLVIDSEYLSDELWEDLKNILKNNKIEISSKYYKSDIVLSDALTPEAINIDLKVILLGKPSVFNLLSSYDEDFKELFQIHSSFDIEMSRNIESEIEYCRFISKYCNEMNIKHLTREAVERIIEYSSRVSDNQNKIALSYNYLYNLLNESDLFADKENKDIIDLDIIEKTIAYRTYMLDNYSKHTNECLKSNTILLDVEGEKVGQVNGLAVYSIGDFTLGEPSKITASTYRGKSKIISIERDIEMSGSTHNKGVNILSGFLNALLSDTKPLHLTTSLTFEQNYYGIDGDSATLAEVCAVLSSMSGVPIKQNLAITGSMNQKGDVQAIGGVNEKIEGFFNACKTLESTSVNGVIIPYSNVQNLMLNNEVVNAVNNKTFEIYSISRIEEAVHLLLGCNLDDVISIIKNKYL